MTRRLLPAVLCASLAVAVLPIAGCEDHTGHPETVGHDTTNSPNLTNGPVTPDNPTKAAPAAPSAGGGAG